MAKAVTVLAFYAVALLALGGSWVEGYTYTFETNGDTFDRAVSSTNPTFSSGDTVVTGAGDHHSWDGVYGAKQVSAGSGVHVWKVVVLAYEDHGANVFELAIGLTTNTLSTWFWSQPESYGYMAEDGRAVNSKEACCDFKIGYGSPYRAGDEVTVTYDSDANTVGFGVNGVDQGVFATGLGSGPFRLAIAVGDSKESVELFAEVDEQPTPAPTPAPTPEPTPAPTITTSHSYEVSGDTFDTSVSSTNLHFSEGDTVVVGHGDYHSWDGSYGTKQVIGGSGVHTWKVKVLTYEDHGANVFELAIGITTNTLSTWFWSQPESYGYMAEDGRSVNSQSSCCSFNTNYGSPFRAGDEVTVTLDSDAGTVSFGVNGVDQGVVGTGLGAGPFRLAVAVGDEKESVQLDGVSDSQETAETWTDYPHTVCKEKDSETSNDDGFYTRYKNIEPNELEKCKAMCVEAETECMGVEYYEETGRCDLFHKPFTHVKQKKNRICSARDKHTGELSDYTAATASQLHGAGSLVMVCAVVGVVAAMAVIAIIRRNRSSPGHNAYYTVYASEEADI